MKKFLIVIFALIAIWDAFTTFIGVYGVTEGNEQGLIYSIVASVLVFAFMIGTTHILSIDGVAGKFMKVFWVIAIIVDVVTSFIGNSIFLEANNWILWGLLIFITLLTSASGIIVSYIYGE